MMGWQDISTAPRDGTALLVWATVWAGEISGVVESSTGGCEIAAYTDGRSDYAGDDWWSCMGGDAYATWCKPTHWMPLPEAPSPTSPESGE